MAQDMFLEIEGVTGESKDDVHKGKIDIYSFSCGVSQSGTMHTGGGGGGGKCSVQDIHLTKGTDKASTELFKKCCSGNHYPKAVLTIRKAGDKPLEYLVYTMTNVIISSYTQGAAKESERVLDQLSLNFEILQIDYKEQSASGGVESDATMTWNISANRPSA